MPHLKTREYRNLVRNLEIRKAQGGSGEPEKIVEGYATTFNEPYMLGSYRDWDGTKVEVWEQVAPTSFEQCDLSDVIMQYNHEGRVFARNSNGTLELSTDDHGLFISANLGGTETGRQLFEEIQGGYTNKMSFGFTIRGDKWEFEEDLDAGIVKEIRTITDIGKLYDVSAVSIPANDNTEISSRGASEGVIARAKEEFHKRQGIKLERERLLLMIQTMEV